MSSRSGGSLNIDAKQRVKEALKPDHAVDKTQAYQVDYQQAEKKAAWYLKEISALSNDPQTFTRLSKDLKEFKEYSAKQNRVKNPLTHALQNGSIDTWGFLEKLSAKRELDAYLTDAISYLFMRDLGMDISTRKSQKLVRTSVSSIINKVESGAFNDSSSYNDLLFAPLLEQADLQSSYYWLMLKLSSLQQVFEEHDFCRDGVRKLVKVVAGVMMNHMITANETQKRDKSSLEKVIRLGYAYGLTYPFVDDLLDSAEVFNEHDKELFTRCLRKTLANRQVCPFPEFQNKSASIEIIYKELKWAFEYIKSTLSPSQSSTFFKRAWVFSEAQSIDRERSLLDADKYKLHSLLTTVIIKSSASRQVSHDLIAEKKDDDVEHRTFCFGIYNQLNDDIKDIDEDLAADNLTPYTWYLKKTNDSSSKTPYLYYWAVVYYLIYVVYRNDPKIKRLFLERSLNAHRSVLQSKGIETYGKLRRDLLLTPNAELNKTLEQLVCDYDSHIWFDKLISKEVSTKLENRNHLSASFKSRYLDTQAHINKLLHIHENPLFLNGRLHDVANYCVGAGGKRIRAVMATVISQDLYGFCPDQITAVIQLLEYMHSASLILDDLPSQDNADTRRGKETIHKKYDVATAELSSVYLMMRAVELQSNIKDHPPKAVLKSLSYSASVTQAICEGQLLDLKTSGQALSFETLEKICQNKTGLAIEAALVIPAILAEQNEIHIKQLKRLAKHMGMIFQIRDDLLDASGNEKALGKPLGADLKHRRVNFLTQSGEETAIKIMFEHYHCAKKILNDFPEMRAFFNELLDYIIYRTS